MYGMNFRIWLVGSLAVIAGCSTASDRATQASRSTSDPSFVKEIANARVTKALDAEVREKVAFRRSGSGWAGGYVAYDSKVSEIGEIAFTPKPFFGADKASRRQARTTREQRFGD